MMVMPKERSLEHKGKYYRWGPGYEPDSRKYVNNDFPWGESWFQVARSKKIMISKR